MQLIQKPWNSSHSHVPLVKRVKDLTCRKWKMHLVHVLGEGNQVVDALANLRHSLNLGITYYCEITSCILGVLQANGYGAAFPHVG